MDKPFNHLIICLTFVMPVAALSGCSGPNDSPEQDAVMSISSCTPRGEEGQQMSLSEYGMFVTDTAGNLYPDNIRVLNRSGKWTFAEISLSDGDKGIYAYYPYNPSFSGGKMGLDARSQTDYLYSERTMVSGNAPSASITLYHLLSKVTFRMPAAVTAVRVADYSYSASYSLLTGSLEIKPEKGTITGVVTHLIFKGVHYEMEVQANGFEWLVHSTDLFPVGQKVGIHVDPFDIQIMNKPESEDEEAIGVNE